MKASTSQRPPPRYKCETEEGWGGTCPSQESDDGAQNACHTRWMSFGWRQMRREMSSPWAAAPGGRPKGLCEKIGGAGEQILEGPGPEHRWWPRSAETRRVGQKN